MIDLKKIIKQLDDGTYSSLEEGFKKNKADNSIYLLQSYRAGNPEDNEIISYLSITRSSLHTLKSRLYDKIQNQFTNQSVPNEEELLSQVNSIHQVCYNNSKEIAIARLTRLAENLKANDMHGELLVVYSALKQLNLFSDKYFHYSQLYNKQIAFNLTTEKSIEILGNFSRILMQYDFSKLKSDLETLQFLHKGIIEQYSLNNSRQIELIKNIIEIELSLFTVKTNQTDFGDPLELLNKSAAIIEKLPYYREQKHWMPVIDYFYFEYYYGKNNLKMAETYFEKTDKLMSSLPFYSNICIISKFLISKLSFMQNLNSEKKLSPALFDESAVDPKNTHFMVNADIYNSVVLYQTGKTKEAISILNNLLNNVSVKDLHYMNINVKLTLAYYYLRMKETDLSESILKNLARKIKSDELQQFAYVNNLIKLFTLEIIPKSKGLKEQQNDLLTLFNAKNGEYKIVEHLSSELNKQYNPA